MRKQEKEKIKIQKYKIADAKAPKMGLDNKICKNPKYWCRLHQIWLSEEDVEKKLCKKKPTYDLMDVKRCNCLEEK